MTPETKNKTNTMTAKAAKPSQLKLERVFNATPERLWTYWTDPKKYARWLSPQKADLVIHELDVRVGGKVRFDMPLDNGQVNKEEGVFHVLDEPRLLVSGSPDKSFLITVTFEPVGAKQTRMKVVVDGVPAEYHAGATEGWGKGMDKLARLLDGSAKKLEA
ncbi:MAG TPA: SRPBCC domain-containing protein [Candidatus Thermoplasmatota archaeon]|nr:SRPBCC domain-containing protein [Candidatus Thermoplasmatota archaeon]